MYFVFESTLNRLEFIQWIELNFEMYFFFVFFVRYSLTLKSLLNDGSKCLKINMIETAHKLSIHNCYWTKAQNSRWLFKSQMHFI